MRSRARGERCGGRTDAASRLSLFSASSSQVSYSVSSLMMESFFLIQFHRFETSERSFPGRADRRSPDPGLKARHGLLRFLSGHSVFPNCAPVPLLLFPAHRRRATAPEEAEDAPAWRQRRQSSAAGVKSCSIVSFSPDSNVITNIINQASSQIEYSFVAVLVDKITIGGHKVWFPYS